jgi:hypothetical protein
LQQSKCGTNNALERVCFLAELWLLSSSFLEQQLMALESIGIKITCPGCTIRFSVCRPCWRGHWYCSVACSGEARARTRRRSNKQYRSSSQGRLAQQRAQRRYRQHLRQLKSVRDHSSKKSKTSLKDFPVHQLPREVKSESSCFRCRSCGKEVLFFIDGRRFVRPSAGSKGGSS